MTAQTPEEVRYVVIAAYRKESVGTTIGYFRTSKEVPPEFKKPFFDTDVTSTMKSMGLTDVDRCLEIMNRHWKPCAGVSEERRHV